MQARALPLSVARGGNLPYPAVCAPLVATTADALLAEATKVGARRPDLLEWRVDFFEGIADTKSVVELAGRLRHAAGGLPLLFTRRSAREGGQAVAISEEQVVALYAAVCEGGSVDLVDWEMASEPAQVAAAREVSRRCGVKLILSSHDFTKTPALDVLCDRFAQAERLGGDVAKVAVMPKGMDDVLTLLDATWRSSRTVGIPLVSMSMGGDGSLSRVCGSAFGSAMTFAVGENASAPGQIPIDDLRTALEVLRKAAGPAS